MNDHQAPSEGLEKLPTIALVTPTFNHAHVLEETIKSVLDQGYPNLQYVVADGGSTDGTREILERYSGQLHAWVSEPDKGQHDAIMKGFGMTDGTVMGWLNSDDTLLPDSLFLVGTLFRDFADVRWLTGEYFSIAPDGRPAVVTHAPRWTRWHLLSPHANGWIAQESTFWRRDLWEEAGGGFPELWGPGADRRLPLALDFELWARFSRYAKLQTIASPIGCYRYLEGQQGVAHKRKYDEYADAIRARERSSALGDRVASLFADFSLRMRRIKSIRLIVSTLLGAPPRIHFNLETYEYRRGPERFTVAQAVLRRLLRLQP